MMYSQPRQIGEINATGGCVTRNTKCVSGRGSTSVQLLGELTTLLGAPSRLRGWITHFPTPRPIRRGPNVSVRF